MAMSTAPISSSRFDVAVIGMGTVARACGAIGRSRRS